MAVKDNASISIDIKLADKALLEDINNNLKRLLKALEGKEKWEPVQAPWEADEVGTNEPMAEAPVEAEEAKEEKTEPTVTKAQLQKMAIELSAQGKKVEVREIVKAYAEKISELPEDKLAEVMERLEALRDGK